MSTVSVNPPRFDTAEDYETTANLPLPEAKA
jgi:hypothetical protein